MMILTPQIVAIMLLITAFAWYMAASSDFPVGGSKYDFDAWIEYRQDLRNRLKDAGVEDYDSRLALRARWQAVVWVALAALVALWGMVHRGW